MVYGTATKMKGGLKARPKKNNLTSFGRQG